MDKSKDKLMLVTISIITLILAIYIITTFIWDKSTIKTNQNSFQTLTNNQNNVEFQVTPLSSLEFQIDINTHSVELDFELTEISILYDDIGNIYKPLKWDGSEPGGHHRSGNLKFPAIDKNAKSIKLIITDTARREFSWNLK